MRIPSLHLNGTSAERLLEPLERAHRALAEALLALSDASPNGRDYYPQGDSALREAVWEHQNRTERLRTVQDELMEISIGIQDQADAQEAQRGRRNPGKPPPVFDAKGWLQQRALIAEHEALARDAWHRARYDPEEAEVAEYHEAEAARIDNELTQARKKRLSR